MTAWPEFDDGRVADLPEMTVLGGILPGVRALRTEQLMSRTCRLESLTIDFAGASEATRQAIQAMELSLPEVARVQALLQAAADFAPNLDGVDVGIVAAEKRAEA